MNRVQSGDMPSMGELMNDPTFRDLCVFLLQLGGYHLIDVIGRRISVAEPMALGQGARDPILNTNNNYHRCGEDAAKCILFTWTKDGFISGGPCERKIKLRTTGCASNLPDKVDSARCGCGRELQERVCVWH
jgi:hypothetical protein